MLTANSITDGGDAFSPRKKQNEQIWNGAAMSMPGVSRCWFLIAISEWNNYLKTRLVWRLCAHLQHYWRHGYKSTMTWKTGSGFIRRNTPTTTYEHMHSGEQWLITAWAMTLFTQHRTEPGTCADTAKRIWKLEENSEPISDMHNVKGYCKQKNKSDLSSSIMFSIIHISYCYICMLLFPWNDQRPNGFIVIVLKQSMEVVCTLFWISWWRSEKKGSPAVALLLLSSGANLNIFFKNHPPPFIIVRGKNYI